MQARHIPNLITALRFLMVPPTLLLLLDERYSLALLIFAIAGISDGVDGFLAKHYGWTSRLGAIMDPLADKLLLGSTFIVLAWLGDLPVWLVAAIIIRDTVIVAGGLAYHFLIGHYEMAPSLISKLTTFSQIMLVIIVLAVYGDLFFISQQVLDGLEVAVLILTLSSGASYVWSWGKRALRSA